ncbi:MAG: hypothetical protein ACE5KF_10265 [Kiloniellaceae bacterium]
MLKAILIGVSTIYLMGVFGFGWTYLTVQGGVSFMHAIAYGVRWPFYAHLFLG